jgi:hypothetical protein
MFYTENRIPRTINVLERGYVDTYIPIEERAGCDLPKKKNIVQIPYIRN